MMRHHANRSILRFTALGGFLLLAMALAAGAGLGGNSASRALANGDAIPGQYIVVLTPGSNAAAVANEMAQANGLGIGHVYDAALTGFSARIPDARLARIQSDPRVVSVEADQVVSIQDQETPTGVQRIYANTNTEIGIDGVDDVRIDVDVAVIDTGIDLTHPDLNVVNSVNCSGGSPFRGKCGSGGNDDNGHGSHVAGTIGALDNGFGVVGVAPGARLWAVKVLNSQGSGYMSWIVAGIDYVAANAASIEVANMSLGCECSSAAMDTAISNAVADGIVFVVAAGNNDSDAATFSPANHDDVITVSALADFNGLADGGAAATCRADQDDTLADFSNFGPLVEIAAPGVCILSTVPGGYATYSGTSMASPHVAGAAALLASANNPISKSDVRSLAQALIDAGNPLWTDDSGDGIQEPLLDVSNTVVFAPVTVPGNGGDGTPTNAPPSASFTFSCVNLTCTFNGSGSADSDGTIASYEWDFGDTVTDSGVAPTHTYATGNTYTVQLTVTDDGGATASASQDVTVPPPPPPAITLSASGYKVKGWQTVDLSWQGTGGANVQVYRGSTPVHSESGDGSYTDSPGVKGGGMSYDYQVCEATNPANCSNVVTISF